MGIIFYRIIYLTKLYKILNMDLAFNFKHGEGNDREKRSSGLCGRGHPHRISGDGSATQGFNQAGIKRTRRESSKRAGRRIIKTGLMKTETYVTARELQKDIEKAERMLECRKEMQTAKSPELRNGNSRFNISGENAAILFTLEIKRCEDKLEQLKKEFADL